MMTISQQDSQLIEDLEASWLRLEMENRHAELTGLLAPGFVLFPPDNESVTGAAAIQALSPPFPIRRVELSDRKIDGGRYHAWKTARFRTVFDREGEDLTIHGHHLWVLTKSADSWRVTALSYQIDS
ncbi:nuclear transport factor 2 family protein [Marinicauda pacifica]|uniref:Nuclear transport factor 2 family protein n=1 Tax=Marinicauda pacifica TaxID=1133559 RepID=A0A4S2HBR8_9PROT|nr:nuclear transport factor 2 family protein [Marinicauda pacifica]TGY93111.1 nuclear transport factor 2 family protein [Marinicauda pacifica]